MPHAEKAISTPTRIEIIYFFAAPVFSSSPRDMIYIIPTIQIPMTATMAAISCIMLSTKIIICFSAVISYHDVLPAPGKPVPFIGAGAAKVV